MGQARDEAGNIWETDASGNPVRLISSANSGPRGQVLNLPPDPMEEARLRISQNQDARAAATAPYDAQKAGANARVAAQTAPYDIRTAAANATKAEADAVEAKAKADKLAAQAKGNPLAAAQAELTKIINQIDSIATDASDNGGWFETGYTGAINRKRPGTAAFDLGNAVKTIDANNAFRTLQTMRDNSPTGGALGGISEGELELLKSTVANLDPNQSQEAFLGNLKTARDHYARLLGNLGGVPPAPPTGGIYGNASQYAPSTNGFREEKDLGASSMIDGMIRSGVPYGQAMAALRKQYPDATAIDQKTYGQAVAHARQNPGYKGSYAEAVRSVPLSGIEKTINEYGQGKLGAFGIATANALTGGYLDELSGNQERAQLAKDIARQNNPGASLAGDVFGGTLAMVGGNAALRGAGGIGSAIATRGGGLGADMLYGGLYGSGESNNDRLGGFLTGAASAGGGNLVGRGITNSVGRGLTGVSNRSVNYLADRNIPMTPGQLFGESGLVGRTLRGVEDKMESVPFLGDAIRSRREEGLQAFNREAFKDALHPIGQTVEGNIGQDAIDQAHGMVSNAYGDALNGVRLRADGPFIRETDRIIADGSKVPQLGEQFNYLVSNKIDPLFDDNLRMGGREFQSALQTLSKAGSEFPKQGIMGQEAGNYSRDLKDSFINLANRQAPHVAPALQAANSANRNVSILGDAVLAGINQSDRGMFTPAMVNRATIANAKKYGGKKAAQAGNVPFARLAEAGQDILPSRVPNSGTTDRALATFLLPTALGGAAYGSDSMDLPAPVTAALALTAAASTKRGNKVIQKLATSRSPEAQAIGEEILKRKRLGGMFGAGLAIPFYGN